MFNFKLMVTRTIFQEVNGFMFVKFVCYEVLFWFLLEFTSKCGIKFAMNIADGEVHRIKFVCKF